MSNFKTCVWCKRAVNEISNCTCLAGQDVEYPTGTQYILDNSKFYINKTTQIVFEVGSPKTYFIPGRLVYTSDKT